AARVDRPAPRSRHDARPRRPPPPRAARRGLQGVRGGGLAHRRERRRAPGPRRRRRPDRPRPPPPRPRLPRPPARDPRQRRHLGGAVPGRGPRVIPRPRPDATVPPSLVVADVFGPTVQGEGPSCGRRSSFIRLGGCNLACEWCDTPETWDARRFDLRQTLTRRPVPEIVARALQGDPDLVVITGGEPLLHQRQKGWRALIGALTLAGAEIEIETNGTVPPTAYTIRWA